MKTSFGDFIRNKREQQQLKMNDFSRQLGISSAYWSRIERNMEKPPKDALIQKASVILKIDPDDAFIEAGRLPPDMREDICNVIRIYRKKGLAPGSIQERGLPRLSAHGRKGNEVCTDTGGKKGAGVRG
jgi:transcriptional regulator with XRE-family HTH domain